MFSKPHLFTYKLVNKDLTQTNVTVTTKKIKLNSLINKPEANSVVRITLYNNLENIIGIFIRSNVLVRICSFYM